MSQLYTVCHLYPHKQVKKCLCQIPIGTILCLLCTCVLFLHVVVSEHYQWAQDSYLDDAAFCPVAAHFFFILYKNEQSVFV